ncbi:hypothetical protein GKZ89_09630 [Bacillus mangrovi]|uniref:Uncharacterized protein n=1 Tax=Metabacillus mangrovi TaxID=1491830 RepID=A0A7X2S5J0_9BACI|nr:hypothetical protein [Metabacillus mangrovi]MTH53663.1 hypothetical protein [Metabacillus mangrovi]
MKMTDLLKITICMALVLLAGCSKPEETNKETIKKVLEQELTAPDKELTEITQDPEKNEKLDQYLEKNYGPYFTEAGLQNFIAAYGGTQYHSYADHSGYKLSFKDVTFEQDESDSNLYTFAARVGYMKSGEEEKTANVEGKVIFSAEEKGQIEAFQYGNDDGLSDILRKQ